MVFMNEVFIGVEMKTIKVKESTNIQLDWLVAKCEGREDPIYRFGDEPNDFYISGPAKQGPYYPSSNWAQGGPLIDKHKIELIYYGKHGVAGCPWEAQLGRDVHYIDQGPDEAIGGPTPLIAAMRAYVVYAFDYADEVEVPEEL